MSAAQYQQECVILMSTTMSLLASKEFLLTQSDTPTTLRMYPSAPTIFALQMQKFSFTTLISFYTYQ